MAIEYLPRVPVSSISMGRSSSVIRLLRRSVFARAGAGPALLLPDVCPFRMPLELRQSERAERDDLPAGCPRILHCARDQLEADVLSAECVGDLRMVDDQQVLAGSRERHLRLGAVALDHVAALRAILLHSDFGLVRHLSTPFISAWRDRKSRALSISSGLISWPPS